MDNEKFMRRIHNKTPSIAKLILLFKYSTSKSPLLIYLTVLIKLFGLVIFSSNFVIKASPENSNQLKGTNVFRLFTLFGLVLDQVSYPVYYAICFLIFIIELSFAGYLIHLALKIKRKQYKNLSVNKFGKLCFYFNILLSQHLIEWQTFIIFSLAKSKLNISRDLYSQYVDKFPMLTQPKAVFINSLYLTMNTLMFIFINFIIYYSFYVLNSSLFSNLSPMRYRHLIQSTIAIICQLFYAFHYIEVVISGSKYALMAFKISMHFVIIFILFFYYILSIKKLEYKNTLGFLTKFILNYCLFSAIIEIFISISNYQLETITILILFFLKLFISFLFTNLYYFMKRKKLIAFCSQVLFNLNEERSIEDYLESGAFILSILTEAKKEDKEENAINELVTIVLNHTESCTSSFCKCKLMNILPHSTTNAEKFKTILYKRIGYLIETTFIRLDLLKHFGIAFLLAEYYFLCVNNPFLAYTLIQSYLAINRNKITLIEYIDFYSLQNEYVTSCLRKYHKATAYVKFSSLFKELFQKKEIKKQILEYCDNFIKLIGIKEAIESTIKIDYNDNGDIKEISSKSLTKSMINLILKIVILQGTLYVNIDKAFSYHSNESFKIEYYYQMYLFYSLFNTRIPQSLKKSFIILEQNNTKRNMTDDLLKIKFENYLRKYFQLKQKEYYIMIKCDKGFAISYFSSELSKFLNFNQSSIIGEPFYTIFPPEFREVHKKSILKELLKQEYFYETKNSFIFDSNGYSYVCDIKTAVFPHLTKYMSIICEIVLDFDKIEANQSFILNSYYNLVSLSKILESKFALNVELIKKCEVDILEIFEISKLFLQKQFETFSKSIEKLKESFQGDTIKILSKRFFINKQIINDSLDICKTKEKLIQCARTLKHPIQNVHNEYRLIERKRLVILHNIIKLLTRYSEIDLHDDSYKKFTESFHQFQTTLNATTMKSVQYAKEGIDMNYIIKIEARCMYNTPIYIFSFQLNQFIQSIESETTGNRVYNDICTKNFSKDLLLSLNNTSSHIDKRLPELLQIQSQSGESNQNIKSCLFDSHYEKNPKSEHIYSEKNIIYTPITKCFFIVSSVIGLCLFIILLVYHRMFFKRIRIIIDTINSNSWQRDIMTQLFSSHLSLISHLVGISSNEYSLDTYINITKNALTLLQKSFKLFSYSYMEYCIVFHQEVNQLEMVNSYISILHDWNNYTYYSEYASEVNKFLFLGQRTVSELFESEAIYSDLALLFQKKYLLIPNTLVKTTFALFSFYIINNNTRFYQLIHLPLYNLLLTALKTNRQLYQLLTCVVEVFVILYYFCFFFFFYLILIRMNSDVFYMIMEMFLYSTKHKRDSLKSLGGNGLLKQKVYLFCEVINNFNEEICLEFQKKQREKATTIISDQQMIMSTSQSQSNTTGGNLTNSTHQNISSNQMLNKNTSSLLKRLNTNKDFNNNHSHQTIHPQKNDKNNNTIEKNALWSTPEFIKYFRVKHLWKVLMFKVLTIISLLICVAFSVLRLVSANDYSDHINIIQVNIDYLGGKYTLALALFNNIRISLMYDITALKIIGNYTEIMLSITDNQELFDNIILHFPLTGTIQQQTLLKNTDPNYNITILCGDDQLCRKILMMDNNFCTNGIDLGISTMFQKYFQIINDFKTHNYQSITIEEIKEYFIVNNMDDVEQTIDFVLIRVQQVLYEALMIDGEKLRIQSEKYVYQMTFPTMLITLVINIVFILVIYLYINQIYNDFSREVFKLNNALFNYAISA